VTPTGEVAGVQRAGDDVRQPFCGLPGVGPHPAGRFAHAEARAYPTAGGAWVTTGHWSLGSARSTFAIT
jgi:hypothetical protein